MRAADHTELTAALVRAGEVNALLTFAEPGAGGAGGAGTPATRFTAGPLVDGIAAWLGVRERRVAASLVVLGYAARLVGPPVAVLLRDGLLLDVRPAAVRYGFAPGAGFRLSLGAAAGWSGPVDALTARWCRDVLDDHLATVIATVRRDTPVAAGLLWGNVASGLLGALATLARAQVVPPERGAAFAAPLLADGPLAGAGRAWVAGGALRFRRRSCCLYYRLPGGGYCGDCSFSEDS